MNHLEIDAIQVLNAIDHDWQSIPSIAQKIGLSPSKRNHDVVLNICRSEEQTRKQAGTLAAMPAERHGGYPYFKHP